MIIIPEIETVVILTPRTGTRSLRRAVEATYPKSMQLYRHMEADGIPRGYDRWKRVGVVRNPVDRLWSLYKYLKHMGISYCQEHAPAYTLKMRRSVDRPFDDWLVNNDIPFTTPYDSANQGGFYPGFTVLHPLPENRKSQFVYLRPDLGTKIFKFTDLGAFHRELGINPPHINGTEIAAPPPLLKEAQDYVNGCFAWDFEASA